jgi:hypothetical protein
VVIFVVGLMLMEVAYPGACEGLYVLVLCGLLFVSFFVLRN